MAQFSTWTILTRVIEEFCIHEGLALGSLSKRVTGSGDALNNLIRREGCGITTRTQDRLLNHIEAARPGWLRERLPKLLNGQGS